jgi:predicted RNA-binding protein with RPS1 domain
MVSTKKLNFGIQLFAFLVNSAHVVSFIASARIHGTRINALSRDITTLNALEGVSQSNTTLAIEKPSFWIEKPCFWVPRAEGSKKQERIHIRDLKVGQKLSGYAVQDLLEGKTGPKVFFECGVGRTNRTGHWSMVNGMLRLEKSKLSVAKKRAARLMKKKEVELFVSRIQLGCGRLEVVATLEEAEEYKEASTKTSISSLSVDQNVTGKIVKLLPYGAMVDIGANRDGLLHIQKVADLYGKYIDKEKGLEKAGLERGTRLRLSVASNDKRRLFLDFTPDVKKDAEEERMRKASKQRKNIPETTIASSDIVADELAEWEAYASEGQPSSASPETTIASSDITADELAEWAAYASEGQSSSASDSEEDEDEEDEDDDYEDDEDDDYEDDEDKDIEDAFGLGSY